VSIRWYLRKTGEWIKEKKDWILIISVLFILLLTAFSMGLEMGRKTTHAPIIIEKCSSD